MIEECFSLFNKGLQFHKNILCDELNLQSQQVCVQPSTAVLNVTLRAFATERRAAGGRPPLLTDSCCLAQARRTLQQSIDGTDTGPLHKPCSAYYASSINNDL